MTQKRDFKKLVRARMAKTGERYAAAHAMLARRCVCGEDDCSSDRERRCEECDELYCEFVSDFYLEFPINYARGRTQYCLACWLCVGPNDIAPLPD